MSALASSLTSMVSKVLDHPLVTDASSTLGVSAPVLVGGTAVTLSALSVLFLSGGKRRPSGRSLAPAADAHTQPFTEKKAREFGDADYIVIGSGMGSLACAALLSKRGHKVLVLEQHDRAGGTTHQFEEEGYEFDTGVHYLGELGPGSSLRILFDILTDNRLEFDRLEDDFDTALLCPYKLMSADDWEPSEPTREFDHPVKKFVVPSTPEGMQQRLLDLFPEEKDQKAIRYFFQMARRARFFVPFFFVGKILPNWLGSLIRHTIGRPFLNLISKTVLEGMSSVTDNRELIGVITYLYGDLGMTPGELAFGLQLLLSTHWLVDGAWYPRGGPSEMARNIIPVIEQAGGRVWVRAPVNHIILDDTQSKAVGVNVRHMDIRARKGVISGAGIINTYTRLLPEGINPEISKLLYTPPVPEKAPAAAANGNGHAHPQSLSHLMPVPPAPEQALHPSIGMISVFVGLDKGQDELNLPRSNEWIVPAWDHDKNMERFRSNPDAPMPAMFLSFSSAKDTSWSQRFPHKSVALIIGPMEYSWVAEYERKQNAKGVTTPGARGRTYEGLKKVLQERMVRTMLHYHPELEEHITHVESGSPLSNNYYGGTQYGEVYGLSHNPARFTEHYNLLKPKTNTKNLYLTGQDVCSAGIAGATLGGMMAAFSIDPSIALSIGPAAMGKIVFG